ncbi:PREDICTED: acyl-CoA-binding domain-containing protein 3-like [Fragaria vesca subsp. vesca]|uniref:acyl-CoA-binding domain-containing protein 3-like n=1 Tax=Fragaria vesca subsp. vesca TaxID=101020 RepID=UPI0002C34EBE|nr:PREDICTED: acyl-CoA-binding domain-containing protein 3-like [Fragaria vesca subsp. vesca]XP_011458849.1 PREDICTED: acyl-CoA-binding domain-containing protein 3-like [Fragaria vesca subsp. vesca]
MELVQDFVWTASVALILSFFVAKLVAIAMADREPEPSEFKSTESAGDGVEEVYRSQRSVQLQFAAAQVQEVDRFQVKPVEEAVGVAEKSDDGEEVSVEKAIDSDRRRGHEDEEISEDRQVDAQSARNDVVTAHEAVEVKSVSYSDEDDWEGIEKSELDEGYTAAVKSEGG